MSVVCKQTVYFRHFASGRSVVMFLYFIRYYMNFMFTEVLLTGVHTIQYNIEHSTVQFIEPPARHTCSPQTQWRNEAQ